jgi:hypothetical protein
MMVEGPDGRITRADVVASNIEVASRLLNLTAPHGCPEARIVVEQHEPSDLVEMKYVPKTESLPGKNDVFFKCGRRLLFCRLSGCRNYKKGYQEVYSLIDLLDVI